MGAARIGLVVWILTATMGIAPVTIGITTACLAVWGEQRSTALGIAAAAALGGLATATIGAAGAVLAGIVVTARPKLRVWRAIELDGYGVIAVGRPPPGLFALDEPPRPAA
ncbi:MAG: hypothetical protein ABMB14_17645 [Myxococcota bacterium]